LLSFLTSIVNAKKASDKSNAIVKVDDEVLDDNDETLLILCVVAKIKLDHSTMLRSASIPDWLPRSVGVGVGVGVGVVFLC